MDQQKDLNNLDNLNILELKSLAYDEIMKRNVAFTRLKVLNDELTERQKQGIEGAAPVTNLEQ